MERTTHFNMKVSPKELEEIKADAHRHGMNMSEYIKWLIQKERESQ